MRPLLRSTLLAVLTVLVAATFTSCGEPKVVGRRVHEPGAVAPPRTTDAPGALRVGNVVLPYRAYGSTVGDGVFPRQVTHAMGETLIAAEPERVVTLTLGDLDTVLTLGLTPVGTVDAGPDGLPDYFDATEVKAIPTVGTVEAPDLAAIAALQPDLILSNVPTHGSLYPQLSQIAPTVFGGQANVAWRENAGLVADALGREEAEREVEQRYLERVAEVAESLPLPAPKMSVVEVLPDKLRIYQRTNFSAQVLTDLGVNRPRDQNRDEVAVDTTFDQVDDAGGDAIFVSVTDENRAVFEQQLQHSEPWKKLEAVQLARVRFVDHDVWTEGTSYSAALALIGELQELYEDERLG